MAVPMNKTNQQKKITKKRKSQIIILFNNVRIWDIGHHALKVVFALVDIENSSLTD
jgi:hypothetical protein